MTMPSLRIILGIFFYGTLTISAFAQQPVSESGSQQTVNVRKWLTSDQAPLAPLPETSDVRGHVLSPALKYARSVSSYVESHVRDYQCVLVKRERIEGDLEEPQFIESSVRTGYQRGNERVPLAVFLRFLGPGQLKGRKVLFIEGENSNKMLVRNGGKRFNYVTVKIDPHGDAAMRESLVPITQIGFDNMTRTFVRLIQENVRIDPQATNTQLRFYKDAKINDRSCLHISVLHPKADNALEFSEVNVYVDNELHVPIRIEGFTWPRFASDPKVLIFEYTYEKLRINVGLTDADFRPSLLTASDGKAPSQTAELEH